MVGKRFPRLEDKSCFVVSSGDVSSPSRLFYLLSINMYVELGSLLRHDHDFSTFRTSFLSAISNEPSPDLIIPHHLGFPAHLHPRHLCRLRNSPHLRWLRTACPSLPVCVTITIQTQIRTRTQPTRSEREARALRVRNWIAGLWEHADMIAD